VRFATVVTCSKCQRPIEPGEGFGFIYISMPGKAGYHFFHRRIGGGDCWETYLSEGNQALRPHQQAKRDPV
jgi:hypothetical protein